MCIRDSLWTDDAKKDIYESVNSACHNDKGDYYEYPLCMTAHCMAVNMTKVKEVGADKYIDTDKHTWSTEGFLNTVDALYKGGYENVAAVYCGGQGGDQGTRAIINNMYGGTFTDDAHTKYTADSAENIKAIQTLYDTILEKKVEYDSATTAWQAAQNTWQAAQIQYGTGSLSQIAYMQQELAYLQARAGFRSADLNLQQAMQNYTWAVKGLDVSAS